METGTQTNTRKSLMETRHFCGAENKTQARRCGSFEESENGDCVHCEWEIGMEEARCRPEMRIEPLRWMKAQKDDVWHVWGWANGWLDQISRCSERTPDGQIKLLPSTSTRRKGGGEGMSLVCADCLRLIGPEPPGC